VQEALAAGLRHIDAAHLYTGGESGATLGAALSPIRDRGRRRADRRGAALDPRIWWRTNVTRVV